jgi:hypothetical protein
MEADCRTHVEYLRRMVREAASLLTASRVAGRSAHRDELIEWVRAARRGPQPLGNPIGRTDYGWSLS